MSIIAYTGLQGSGKSYGVVANVLIPAIKTGRRVFTNIPLKQDHWLAEHDGRCPVQFDMQDLIDNPNWFNEVFEPGAICVLDELWRLWPSGLKANQVPVQHKSFLAEHRHLVGDDGFASEIVFVTQDLDQIASFARSLVEYTYRAEKLSAVGQDKRFRVDVFQGPVRGPAPPKTRRIRELYGTYKPEIFDYYYSHTMSETGGSGLEEKPDQRYNMLKSTSLKARLIAIPVLAFVVYWGGSSVLDYYGGGDDSVGQGVDQSPAAQPVGQAQKAPPSRPVPQARPQHHDVLSGRSLSIIWNNENGDVLEYRIAAETDDGHTAELGFRDLIALDYEVRPVNQCLLVLTINGKKRVVTCRKPKALSAPELAVPVPTFSGSDDSQS